MLENLFWIVIALLGFGLLITVHEAGHCLAAKRGGVQVNEFWIGMGPKLLSKQWGETTYCLCLLPIGGACVMEGEDADSSNPRAFGNASRWTRFCVLFAGVFMNFLLGLVILLAATANIDEIAVPVIGGFYEGFEAEGTDGLMVGDRILSVDGYHVLTASDVSEAMRRGSADGRFDFVVQRDGARVAVDGLALSPDIDLGEGRRGFGLRLSAETLTPAARLRHGVFLAVNDARMVWHSLGDLVTGAVGVDQLSGPVGVVSVTAQTAKAGFLPFWMLMAFISINLGVMNLLPIPGLDGGRILFLAVETVRRKPLDARVEGYVNTAGLLALFALILYVTGQDIMRLLI